MTRKERIVEMARKQAGTGRFILTDKIDEILEAGWNGIEVGEEVYRNQIYTPANKVYKKAGENEISFNGQTVKIGDEQKEKLLDTYTLIKILIHDKK